MDHNEALKLEAAEKYVLGELPEEVREEYEDHYFECADCLSDLEALDGIVTASRLLLREEPQAVLVPVHQGRAERPGWFTWLKPAVAMSAIAALAGVILFQNLVTIPAARQQGLSEPAAALYQNSFRLQGATRGPGSNKVTLQEGESFGLQFDFTPSQVYESYRGSLLDALGKSVFSFRVEGNQSNRELHLAIPGGIVRPGNYDLVFSGLNRTLKQSPEGSEVQRISFVVENRPE